MNTKNKVDNQLIIGDLATQAYRGDRGKIAYDHSQVAHAPSNAQKNSDITKAEIEAKLTGTITSHSHALPTHTHTKSQITDFPTSMPPTAHNHDDRYYTETEVDTKLSGKQDKLVAGDNITIVGNTISASGGGSSTAQVDTLVWSSPILTPLGIDKLVIHYAYYDKNPRDVIVTLNVGTPVEIPLPVFASYSFAQASTQFAGAVITNITEVSPDYDFVVFAEDINRINADLDFKNF